MDYSKKMAAAFALVAMMFCIPAIASASYCMQYGGKAYIPAAHHYKNNNGKNRTNLYFTNISSSTISMTLKMFDHTGAALTQIELIDGTRFWGAIQSGYHDTAAGTVTFELAANSTAVIQVVPDSTGNYVSAGHFVVTWASENVEGPAVIGRVRGFFEDPNNDLKMMGSFDINGGKPF